MSTPLGPPYGSTTGIGRTGCIRRTCGAKERETGKVRPSARCAMSFPFSRLVPVKAWPDIQCDRWIWWPG